MSFFQDLLLFYFRLGDSFIDNGINLFFHAGKLGLKIAIRLFRLVPSAFQIFNVILDFLLAAGKCIGDWFGTELHQDKDQNGKIKYAPEQVP